ncbi:hypothetical protein SDC9_206197 [bioreactor metagenome]|uniref:DUF1320 domain-containing protein n=1 Tax=bioreactor metagenome TaxID=1076179 RepID=A0A645J5T8_9ZZZZ
MSYATASDFEERLGALFGNVYPGVDGAAAAQSDLESAAAEVDGALAFRYTLPVTGTRSLALLKDWTLTLAEERAYARTAGSGFAEKVKTRAAQVRAYLEMVRTDRFRLPDAEERKSSNSPLTLTKAEPPVFGRDNMEEF